MYVAIVDSGGIFLSARDPVACQSWWSGTAALEPATWETKAHPGERLLPFPYRAGERQLTSDAGVGLGTQESTTNGFCRESRRTTGKLPFANTQLRCIAGLRFCPYPASKSSVTSTKTPLNRHLVFDASPYRPAQEV
jgi:hypothetical protein